MFEIWLSNQPQDPGHTVGVKNAFLLELQGEDNSGLSSINSTWTASEVGKLESNADFLASSLATWKFHHNVVATRGWNKKQEKVLRLSLVISIENDRYQPWSVP